VTDELLTFHEVVNQMQEMEDDILDEHKSIYEVSSFFIKSENSGSNLNVIHEVNC
jgi:hypothetical protein